MHQKIIFSIVALFSGLFLLSGCIKDKCESTTKYVYFEPVYKTRQEVRADIKSNNPREPESTGKLFIVGGYIFLNEMNKGVHVIDNRNPTKPKNVAFIDIPGNLDLAVKGNILYADMYSDLVAIDISNPLAVKVTNFKEGVFPHRVYGYGFIADDSKVIVDWIRKDTVMLSGCSQPVGPGGIYMNFADASAAAAAPAGKGGSMARFTIINHSLYTVSNATLNVFDISQAASPEFIKEVVIPDLSMVETIFPLKQQLFIGAQNGMSVFDVADPVNPKRTGMFAHVRSCDPVIADENYAYVTLRSGTQCQGFTNQLEVLKLNHIYDPELIKTYQLSNPHGLSKDGDYLFICDGAYGLKMYDASDVRNIRLLHHVKAINTFDVIAFDEVAVVVAKDGLYQYSYAGKELQLLSKIPVKK